jgi:hypothetical protein
MSEGIALLAIKILRRLPHSERIGRHLDRCAALAVFYAPFGEGVPELRLGHVLGLVPLPSVVPGSADLSDHQRAARGMCVTPKLSGIMLGRGCFEYRLVAALCGAWGAGRGSATSGPFVRSATGSYNAVLRGLLRTSDWLTYPIAMKPRGPIFVVLALAVAACLRSAPAFAQTQQDWALCQDPRSRDHAGAGLL